MKKNLYILVVFILIILTGCTSDFKVNEELVKDISDKITEKVIEKTNNEMVEKKETHTFDVSNSIELIVNNIVGDINITSNDSSEAIIDVTIKANSKNRETAKKLLEDYTYTVESKWKTIKIDTSQYNNNLNAIANEIKVDLNIKIPKNIKNIVITNNVGDVKIENVNGELKSYTNVGDINITNSSASYDIKIDVGQVNLNNCEIVDKSNFKINTGDIALSASNISDAKDIFIETNVGNIKMTLPESSDYKADINEFMKKQRIQTHGDSKTNIKLVTNVGNIDFN